MYISPEFQLGQVYMGDDNPDNDDIILYRPVYVCVPHEKSVPSATVRETQASTSSAASINSGIETKSDSSKQKLIKQSSQQKVQTSAPVVKEGKIQLERELTAEKMTSV